MRALRFGSEINTLDRRYLDVRIGTFRIIANNDKFKYLEII